jgi:hypothetical protein
MFPESEGGCLELRESGIASSGRQAHPRCSVPDGARVILLPQGESANLFIRNFKVNPSGEYADVPWEGPDDPEYTVQACSVNNPGYRLRYRPY